MTAKKTLKNGREKTTNPLKGGRPKKMPTAKEFVLSYLSRAEVFTILIALVARRSGVSWLVSVLVW
jgi:hypothetical protein